MRSPSPASQHFEVVGADNKVVGNIKHATIDQARQLLSGLRAAGMNRELYVAKVTEQTVVKRTVKRMPLLPTC